MNQKKLKLFVLLLGILHSTAYAKNFYVNKYGARANNSGFDSTTAFSNAVAAAQALKGGRHKIVLGKGTYYLKCSGLVDWQYCVNLMSPNASTKTSISFQGAGKNKTQIIIKNPKAGFMYVQDQQNIAIQGFTVDYAQRTFTQGTVLGSSSNKIKIRLDSGYPSFYANHMKGKGGVIYDTSKSEHEYGFAIVYDKNGDALHRNGADHYRIVGAKKISGRDWELTLRTSSEAKEISSGERMAFTPRRTDAFRLYCNSNITLKDVKIKAAPGVASAWVENNGAITIKQVDILRSGNRLISTNADAFHFQENRARIKMYQSHIGGMGDDAINVYSRGQAVSGVNSARNLIAIPIADSERFKKGDTIQFVNSSNQSVGTARISSRTTYTSSQSSVQYLKLDRVVSNLAAGQTLYSISASSPNSSFSSNVFYSFRGFFRIRSQNALLVANKIYDDRNIYLLKSAQSSWNEGPNVGSNFFFGNYNTNMIEQAASGSNIGYMEDNLTKHPLAFNATVYKLLNPDLSGMDNANLAYHWQNHGIYEGRIASLSFAGAEYIGRYTDIKNAFGASGFNHAAVHFLTNGQFEGRQGTIYTDTNVFNLAAYRKYNKDISSFSNAQLIKHWRNHGIFEGRRAHTRFHSKIYLNRYSDLKNAFGSTGYQSAIWHYALYGKSEGRNGK